MKTLDEIIDSNLRVLQDPEDDDAITTAKEIICPFYKKGGNTMCRGCVQSDELVEGCKGEYISKIVHRPMEIWSAAFDELEVREKTSIDLQEHSLRCDRCNISDHCPKFKARSTCAISWGSQINTNDNKAMMNRLIEIQEARINFARSSEVMDGGQPDQTLSNEMDRLQGMLAARADMNADKFSISIEGKSTNNGGGVLSKLFGGMGGTNQPAIEEGNATTIPITANESKPTAMLDVNKVEFIEEPPLRNNRKIEATEPVPVKAKPSKRATIIKKKQNED